MCSAQAGVLVSHTGLHALRKSLEDEWYAKTLETRAAKKVLVETAETFCHSADSPHFADDEPDNRVLDPNSPFRRIWDAVQLIFLVYVSLFVPYRVCFDDPPEPWRWDFIVDIAVDLFFVTDVILSFFTGACSARTPSRMRIRSIGSQHSDFIFIKTS